MTDQTELERLKAEADAACDAAWEAACDAADAEQAAWEAWEAARDAAGAAAREATSTAAYAEWNAARGEK